MGKIMEAVLDGLRSVMLDFCDIIYRLISFAFDTFELLGSARLLDEEAFQSIFDRIGLLLGLFMVFRLSFAFVNYIINPDDMEDKEKGYGNLIKKVLVVVVLLGSVKYLFQFAYKVQTIIIEEEIIPRIVLGKSSNGTNNFGNELSSELFFAFFRLNGDASSQYHDGTIDKSHSEFDDGCIDWYEKEYMQTHVKTSGDFSFVYACVNDKYYPEPSERKSKYVFDFDGGGLLALGIGVFALYTIFIFTLQVGVRLVQLAYLEVISPIPIMMYLMPKGNEYLNKWWQQCLTTFLDFFIRSAIIYFVVFIIQEIMKEDSLFQSILGGGGWQDMYVVVIMIIALLIFARKIPQLLGEIFPSMGGAAKFDFGLNMPNEAQRVLRAGAGVATGATVGLLGNGIARGIASYRQDGNLGRAIGSGLLGGARGALGGAGRGLIGGARNQHLNEIYNDRTNRNRQNITDTINNSDIMREHARNEAVMNARKAIMDEAEKRLLSATGADRNDALRVQREELDALRNQSVPPTHEAAHAARIAAAETAYQQALETASNDWINQYGTDNEVVRRNVAIINNNSDANINLDRPYGPPRPGEPVISDLINDARNTARTYNATHAAEIANNEATLEDMNRQHGGGH